MKKKILVLLVFFSFFVIVPIAKADLMSNMIWYSIGSSSAESSSPCNSITTEDQKVVLASYILTSQKGFDDYVAPWTWNEVRKMFGDDSTFERRLKKFKNPNNHNY